MVVVEKRITTTWRNADLSMFSKIDQSRSIGIIFVVVVVVGLFRGNLHYANLFEFFHESSQFPLFPGRCGGSINGHIYCQRFTIVRDGILSLRGFAVVTHYGCVLGGMVSQNSPKSVTEKKKKTRKYFER